MEFRARQYLRRHGVLLRELLSRESGAPPWRELLPLLRALEARGEIRGGRFVAGMSGEQYALPEAVDNLRAVRRREGDGSLVAVSGCDPLNLVGIVTPGGRITPVPGNRVVFRDGVPVAAAESGETRILAETQPAETPALTRLLARRAGFAPPEIPI